MDKRINFTLIEESYGCDNCIHQYGAAGMGACEYCSPDTIPPSHYLPDSGTIQEKTWKGRYHLITYKEYLRFLKDEYD